MQISLTAIAVCEPADGAINFARDDVLLDHARATGSVVLRLYTWDRPVVSFGRNERVVGRYSPGRIATAGLDVARRRTGGRALLHHRELTYAVAGPVSAADTLHATYAAINALLANALRRLGLAVEVAAGKLPALAEGAPCFAAPSRGELVIGGRKLVASAQWREVGAFVQHGSMLVDDDQPLLARALADGVRLPPTPQPATLRALLGRAPSLDELAAALVASATTLTGVVPERVPFEELLPASAVAQHAAHYRDPAWTWRR